MASPSTSGGADGATGHAVAGAILVHGPIIVGAGPAGLAVAACLTQRGIPYTVIERADCVGSLWKNKTYDRLHLHIPKDHSELPFMKFPEEYPAYPSGKQFSDYLDDYAEEFDIRPLFNHRVLEASYLSSSKIWRVVTEVSGDHESRTKNVYLAKWLVVATGENADPVMPVIPGLDEFSGKAIHSSHYRNGDEWRGKKVLVVGCGNSGFEVALDLANHGAKASLVVRSPMHVLPREMFGVSTFVVGITLLRHLSYRVTDMLLLQYASLVMGKTAKWGIPRPSLGPLQRKDKEGITPVLDVGTLRMIRTGRVKVVKGVTEITSVGAVFSDGTYDSFDGIIFATGFRSSVPKWLRGDSTFGPDGIPRLPFPHGWKGDRGLFTAGFTKRGLKGAAADAQSIAAYLSNLKTSVIDISTSLSYLETQARDFDCQDSS